VPPLAAQLVSLGGGASFAAARASRAAARGSLAAGGASFAAANTARLDPRLCLAILRMVIFLPE
jgi:hypothetical protein